MVRNKERRRVAAAEARLIRGRTSADTPPLLILVPPRSEELDFSINGATYDDEVNIGRHLKRAQMKALNLVHRVVLRFSGGRLGWSIGAMPAVELHTVGRLSGIRRTTMLTAPIHDAGRYVLVASMGGDDRHPQWYLNLVANPDVELSVRGHTLAMRARTATPAEKAEMWPRIVAAGPSYAGYQKKTERDIPVVICELRWGDEAPADEAPAG